MESVSPVGSVLGLLVCQDCWLFSVSICGMAALPCGSELCRLVGLLFQFICGLIVCLVIHFL